MMQWLRRRRFSKLTGITPGRGDRYSCGAATARELLEIYQIRLENPDMPAGERQPATGLVRALDSLPPSTMVRIHIILHPDHRQLVCYTDSGVLQVLAMWSPENPGDRI